MIMLCSSNHLIRALERSVTLHQLNWSNSECFIVSVKRFYPTTFKPYSFVAEDVGHTIGYHEVIKEIFSGLECRKHFYQVREKR